ncbi:MAG: bifunctional diaminohydroxyphosphoribosylaminopyrimidine deaminase/5-amino-6-(5-phosphoribosylamino)uracil reductase RibD [Prevotella sp.]|nr:bifunctional diaminohydroxyphosphoribosylaminopyrimidine deaminase/5-amino-6-(5-phosphoribosylamino)uracil reductase RibD [Prevotella sp.]
MNKKTTDEIFMHRCLQLAVCGHRGAPPNPMVGAVIVHEGRIIGEGYHIRCGEGHAEVNAFASVQKEDEPLLHEATIYVSLEPCAHHGKTPPCADLIVSKGVRQVVVGCVDPFAKVQGRGIEKLRNAGIEVTVGVLEEECQWLNRRFFTYHEKHRPYILLKWAQTADGFIDDHGQAAAISTPFTRMLVHQLRSEYQAILVGRITDEREHPRLDTRLWGGPSPRRYVLGGDMSIPSLLKDMYAEGILSLMVEGGRRTLQSFLDAGLWDELRIETSPLTVGDGTLAPELPATVMPIAHETIDGNKICYYKKL